MDGNLEAGYEKIAIYYRPGTVDFLHVARQLSDGRWTSKLGRGEDITHNTVEGLEGVGAYGRVARFMRRSLSEEANG
jgi:hypothetical protein